MKTNKNDYPLVVGALVACAAILPITFAGEKEFPEIKQVAVSSENDAVVQVLEERIIKPLNLQAKRYSRMSRKGPSAETKYHLVETTSKDAVGERTFTVVRNLTHFSKSKAPTTTDYLKLRYTNVNQEVLVSLKEQWVKVEEHPVLKNLPQPKKETITP